MMHHTYTIDNKVQYIPITHSPMPRGMPLAAPMTFMPQMVPTAIPFQPLPLPPIGMPYNPLPLVSRLSSQTSIPATTPTLFFNGSSISEFFPESLTPTDSEGRLLAPPGYSFVTMSVPSASAETAPSVCSEGDASELQLLDPASLTTEVTRSRSSSVVSVREEPVAETPARAPKKAQPKKFRHRSKQERILEVHAQLKEEYTAKGLYAGDDEVLRGFDTVRVHVKTYKALNQIACPLNEVEKHPGIKVLRIATPFSMKNRFQKKGFIVYLKLASADMVPLVQDIFYHYREDFAKCDRALKKEDKQRLDRNLERESALKGKLSSISDRSSSGFLSERAYSQQGVQFDDRIGSWAGMGC